MSLNTKREERERLVWENSTIIISIRTSSPPHFPCPNTSSSNWAEASGSTQHRHVFSQSVCLRLPWFNQLRQTKYLWRVYATWFDLSVDFLLQSRLQGFKVSFYSSSHVISERISNSCCFSPEGQSKLWGDKASILQKNLWEVFICLSLTPIQTQKKT